MAARTWVGVIVWTVLSGYSSAALAASPFHQPADHSGRTDSCETCHRLPATRTHVTGVRPTFDVPAMYPLGSNGELTCLTCHEAPSSPVLNGRLPVRGALDGSSFCRSCHDRKTDDGSRLAHALRVGTAHGERPRTPNGKPSPALDAASLDCLGCHDGVIGRDGHWAVQPQMARTGRDFGHPVGVDYAYAQTTSETLRPAMLLDAALRLENGKVGCLSCHDAFSRLANQVVVDNRGSALCIACHKM